MFKFDTIDLQQIATAAVGAVILSTACIGAAVGPARAIETDRTIQIAAVPQPTQARA